MSGDRLTRTELSWLLTQEARSAAEKLRRGVGLTIPPPESTPHPPQSRDREGTNPTELILPSIEDTGVETTLNRLDETINGLEANLRLRRYLARALAWPDRDLARELAGLGDLRFFPT